MRIALRHGLAVVAVTSLLASLPAGQANAAAYTFTIINAPLAYNRTSLLSINNAGQILGTYSDQYSVEHGFVDTNGSFASLNLPVSQFVSPENINNSGQITYYGGSAPSPSPPNSTAFIDTAGVLTSITVPNEFVNHAVINDLGHIAGNYSSTSTGTPGLFLEVNGNYSLINSNYSLVKDINNLDQIVGNRFNGNFAQSFVETAGVFTPISVPGAGVTSAYGINDSGQLAGTYTDPLQPPVGGLPFPPPPASHGFVDIGGNFSTVDFPMGNNTEVFGINNQGQLIGDYSDATGGHNFLATPVPEPASVAIFSVGIAALGVALTRRRRHAS